MALSSMTGFARCNGTNGAYAWAWELRSVNGKNLDLRLRLPPGWDAVEAPARARAAEALSRGTIHATLSTRREGELAVIAGFGDALGALAGTRRQEGAALAGVLGTRLDEIGRLAARAEGAPGRRPEAIRSRLAEQVAVLVGVSDRFDADRLHQEAILIASKADVREELDRLAAHVEQGRNLLAQGGAVGRRLDFLAQELQREANTLCAKSNDVELTNIGLELKSVVEQFREQVQNLE